MVVKFRIMSDLHLEFYNHVNQLTRQILWTEEDKDCHLLLVGDIGNPLTARKKKGPINYRPNGHFVELLKTLKSRFLSVVMISGNHEYYSCKSHNRTIDEMDGILKQLAELAGVVFLQCETHTIVDPDTQKQIVIYGTTLFTPITEIESRGMNDIVYIADRPTLVSTHRTHLNWLLDQTFSPETSNIVMTHHVPFGGSHSGYYAGIIDRVKLRGPIAYWPCGHTHTNINKSILLDDLSTIPTAKKHGGDMFGPTQVVSCCIGYPQELGKQPPLYISV